MKVKRFNDAKPYEVPNHRNYTSLRLIGPEDGGKSFSIGLSHFLPGGGAGPDASPLEKTYTILSGELTVIVDGKRPCCARSIVATSGPTRCARSSTAATRS